MISQVELNHGVALARLCRWSSSRGVLVRVFENGRSAYVLDERAGLYLKYSSKRMSPWAFSFSSEHQEEIALIANAFESVFVGLICGTDGIACLDHSEYKRLLDDNVRPVEWVRATRHAREKYTLTGSDSVSSFKIADSEFPSKVYSALEG